MKTIMRHIAFYTRKYLTLGYAPYPRFGEDENKHVLARRLKIHSQNAQKHVDKDMWIVDEIANELVISSKHKLGLNEFGKDDLEKVTDSVRYRTNTDARWNEEDK